MGTLRSEASRTSRYGNPRSIVVLQARGVAQHGTIVDDPSRTMAAASTLLKDSIRWADSVGRSGDGGSIDSA